jgi:membrane protein
MLSASQLGQLVKCTIQGWIDDGAPSMGAALAFYTLFALAPLLLLIIAITGAIVGRDAAQDALIAQIAQVTGPEAASGIRTLLEAAGSRERSGIALVAGAAMLLLGATTLFAELHTDLNRIWRHRPAKAGGVGRFLATRLRAFTLVMAIGALLLGSVVATTVLTEIGERWFPGTDILLHLGEFAVSFVVTTALFAAIYKVLPAPRLEWGDVWIGAAVTSLLFWAGKLAIALYIARTSVGASLGAAGPIIVLVAWVYYSSQIFFLGAEFTRHYALRHGSKQAEPVERRRQPYVVSSDSALVERAERLVRGEDPVLERPRKRA